MLQNADDCRGFETLRNPGRLQKLQDKPYRLWVDVGHNAAAARILADFLAREDGNRDDGGKGRRILLLGMLEDKQPREFLVPLQEQIDEVWLLGLDGERGLSAGALVRKAGVDPQTPCFETAAAALEHALSSLGNQDILLATGSFLTVEAVIKASSNSTG